MNMKAALFAIIIFVSGCSNATYKIIDPNNETIQLVRGSAPGGETATMIIYYGPDAPPSIQSKVDNEDFVRATAQLGRQALITALKVAM